MALLAFLAAFVFFLIGAVAPLFEWSLGKFDPTAWGLVALSLGFLLPVLAGLTVGAVTSKR